MNQVERWFGGDTIRTRSSHSPTMLSPVTERHRRTVAHPSFTEILPGPRSLVRRHACECGAWCAPHAAACMVTLMEWCIDGHSVISYLRLCGPTLFVGWTGHRKVPRSRDTGYGFYAVALDGSTHLAARCLTTTRPLISASVCQAAVARRPRRSRFMIR